MQFRSFSDLHSDILHGLWKLPPDIDLVVGVPRSGMLAASIISLLLNRPLVDLAGFTEGRVFQSGTTRRRLDEYDGFQHALVVDDSSHSGAAMAKVRRLLAECDDRLPKVTTCVVYGTETSSDIIDVVLEIVKSPRIFEWNVMHHPKVLAHACLDIDGVLCHDPTDVENDDGERYEEFLLKARPLYIPSHPVGALVTSRLEKYRPHVERWLSAHGVLYNSLIMLNMSSAKERRRAGGHARHKAMYYANCSATLFIESDLEQAWTIARESGKPVLSIEGSQLCIPTAWSPQVIAQRLSNKRLLAQWLRTRIGDRSVDWLRELYLKVWR